MGRLHLGVEGFLLYRAVVTVFDTGETKRLNLYLFGYGIPLVIGKQYHFKTSVYRIKIMLNWSVIVYQVQVEPLENCNCKSNQCCGAAIFMAGSGSVRSRSRLRPNWVGSGSRQK